MVANEWQVDAQDLAAILEEDFWNGPIITESGLRYSTEETVARVNGLKIQIFANEHPPPHFRVVYQGESANFSIKDCTKLNGGLDIWIRNIRKWHAQNKAALIAVWNKNRPSDCPVGAYRE